MLLIDEVLAVGDEAFQRKCLRHILSRIEQGTTVVLVSHAPGTIERACRRVVVLDAGRVVFDGPTVGGPAVLPPACSGSRTRSRRPPAARATAR